MKETITIYIVTIEWQGWESFAESIPFRTEKEAKACLLKWANDFNDEQGNCTRKVSEDGCSVNVFNDDYYMVANVNKFNL